MSTERNRYIDIIKGIGIISIVIGHSSSIIFNKILIGRFVYMHHLMIFFFVAGYCFKEKYTDDISLYIGKRLVGTYSLFIKYGIAFVLMHNILVKYHFVDGIKYSVNDMILKFSSILLMRPTETLLSACWFLPVLFFLLQYFAYFFQ